MAEAQDFVAALSWACRAAVLVPEAGYIVEQCRHALGLGKDGRLVGVIWRERGVIKECNQGWGTAAVRLRSLASVSFVLPVFSLVSSLW